MSDSSKPDDQIATLIVQNLDFIRPVFENSCPVFVDYCRAKNNLSACTLNICEQHIVSRKIAEKEFCNYAVLFCAHGVDHKLLTFHPSYQAGFENYLQQEEAKGKKSDLSDVTDDDVYKSVISAMNAAAMDDKTKEFIRMLSDPFTSLCQALWYWFENHGLSMPYNFRKATLLHTNYHGDIKNDKKNNMGKDVLMAICVGCGFDLRMTQRVFNKAKIPLDEFTDPDKTYIWLIDNIPGMDILDFNECLKRANIKELGTETRQKQ